MYGELRLIGERRFDIGRQRRFAALSGDHNPIHVDPIAVRRTLPGRLVVHGVHVLLWALDRLAAELGAVPPPVARLRVRFMRFTYVGDEARVIVAARHADGIDLTVIAGEVVRAEIRVSFGAAAAPAISIEGGDLYPVGIGPLDNGAASFDERHGQVSFVGPPGALAADFPLAARWLGAARIDALAAATRLVGMIYPGLHSILGGIDVRTTAPDGHDALGFRMGELRYGQIDADVCGGGIVGTLDCRVPNPPVAQPSSEALRALVTPGRYAGAEVLVIGGSRGAGEACAKLLALGGASVSITYRDGADDAAAVAADIVDAGGLCTVRRFDAAEPIELQLGGLAPTHGCWFATPLMVRSDTTPLDEARMAECHSILAARFFAFAQALHRRRSTVRLFYPSTEWIDAPPAAATEYVMAKAAAEVLVRSLAASRPRIEVSAPRLPAMATDQTARMSVATVGAAATLLPHLDRLMHRG